MFRNLNTSTKLLVLCGIFIITLGVTTYSLVMEKQIAVDFAKKEVAGNRHVADLRTIYTTILAGHRTDDSSSAKPLPADELLRLLPSANSDPVGLPETGELEQALAGAIRELSRAADGPQADGLALEALIKAQRLISRIGDDSNLTLDPDLDTYYLQDIAVTKLPAWLIQLSELRALSKETASGHISSGGRTARVLALKELLLASADGIQGNLAAAYRGNTDGSVREAVDQKFNAAISATRSLLNHLSDRQTPGPSGGVDQSAGVMFDDAIRNVISAWAATQSKLDSLLHQRIDSLLAKLSVNLAVIGALGATSILIALLTHRHIVGSLKRFEAVANAVRETKDYGLRVDLRSRDEIGRLAEAFNDMLSELFRAHAREATEQAELARVTRLTTMGAMTASIAHEVNQPLAAIVANSSAALRWLANKEPDLNEASAALKRIVRDGHRASEVIASVRAMFKKDRPERTSLAVNDLVHEALLLTHAQLHNHGIVVKTELREGLPEILADRVQLQQVLINLIINSAEAMASVMERERLLLVTTDADDAGAVRIAVTDSGTGIDPDELERIFEPFVTTKTSGMGLGLAICRSIVESHGGRLWVVSSNAHGSTFHMTAPGRVASI